MPEEEASTATGEWDGDSFAGRVNASVDRLVASFGGESIVSSLAEDNDNGESKSVLRPKIKRVREAANEKLGAVKAQ